MKDLSKEVNIERISLKDDNFFSGYYDISPENSDGNKVLASHAFFIDHMCEISDVLEIGYFDVGCDKYNKIGETHAWNFQEGCRLQWLDNKRIIYNDRSDTGFCAKVYDVESKSIVKTYDMPIYSISKKYNVAVTYGFVNNKYFYAHTNEEGIEDKFGDGVYMLDLNTGEHRLIIPVNFLAEMAQSKSYHNWVEFCTISPDSDRFFLIHRWDDKGTLMGNQLCVGDFKGNVSVLLNSKFISHTGWRGNSELSSWSRIPGKINGLQRNTFLEKTGAFRVARDIYHMLVKDPSVRQKFTNDAYILFDLKNNTKNKIQNSDFTSDGHCTWSEDKRYMLTDTYPDSEHKRSLIIYDSLKDELLLLGKFYAIPNGISDLSWDQSPLRCDLHPKWGSDEKYVYFDSVHEGFRGVYRIDVTRILERA